MEVSIAVYLLFAYNNAFGRALEISPEKNINALVPDSAVADSEEFNELVKYIVSGNHEHHKSEVTMNITELIRNNGFKTEEYHVETEDGYILGLFRIPGDGQVVFLMHGLLGSADDWVTPGTESGLAYLLAARGFDVWMGNARGNKHSSHHKTIRLESREFWDFSYQEIGIYDVPAMIDFALEATNQSQLVYIGHSQGTTNFFVMASEKLEYNSKIALMIALAPAAALPHIRSPFFLFVRALTLNHNNLFFKALRLIGYYRMLPETALTKFLTIAVCGNRFLQWICKAVLYIGTGLDYTQLNYTTLPTIFSHAPAGSATKVFEHYGQTVANGEFRKFDYGAKRNVEKYGSEIPPDYSVGNITAPIALFYGKNDELTDVRDVLTLRQNLRSVIKFYKVPYKKFDHLDFIYAKDYKKLVFPLILDLINTYGVERGSK